MREPGADRAADVKVIEDHSLGSHAIEVRSGGQGGAVEADVAVAHVVDEDEDDVGLLCGWKGRTTEHTEYTKKEEEEAGVHDDGGVRSR